MHNKSPIPVKWAGECGSLAWALLAEVSTWCHSELYWFFSPMHPPPLKKKTHSHTDRLWCHHPSLFPTPHPFLPFPLPYQHKPVMWLSQIMRWEFYCTSLWGWQRLRPLCSLPGIRRPLLTPVGSYWIHRLISQVLQQCTSKWEIKGWLAHDIQRMTMPQPAYTYCYVPVPETQRHTGCSRTTLLYGGSTHLRGGIYIQEEGSALCVFYRNTGG